MLATLARIPLLSLSSPLWPPFHLISPPGCASQFSLRPTPRVAGAACFQLRSSLSFHAFHQHYRHRFVASERRGCWLLVRRGRPLPSVFHLNSHRICGRPRALSLPPPAPLLLHGGLTLSSNRRIRAMYVCRPCKPSLVRLTAGLAVGIAGDLDGPGLMTLRLHQRTEAGIERRSG